METRLSTFPIAALSYRSHPLPAQADHGKPNSCAASHLMAGLRILTAAISTLRELHRKLRSRQQLSVVFFFSLVIFVFVLFCFFVVFFFFFLFTFFSSQIFDFVKFSYFTNSILWCPSLSLTNGYLNPLEIKMVLFCLCL